jgi:hypothetical protein
VGVVPLLLSAVTALAEIVMRLLYPDSLQQQHTSAVSCQGNGDDVEPELLKVLLIGVEVLFLQLLYRGSRSGTYWPSNPGG